MSALRQTLARGVYSALLVLLSPVYLARLWWRGRVEPPYRDALGERFGRYDGLASSGWVWVHAVSLGETRAAAALVDALRTARPGMRLLLTNGTATGRDAGRALLREGDAQVWLPFDTPGATDRFLAQFAPAIGVLMETEVWPNLLHAAQRRRIPVVLANARLSERSQRRGQRFDSLLRPAVESFAAVLAQTDDDARRLREGGARSASVVGNLKYDLAPDPTQLARGRAWRAGLGRAVVLAASFRDGEEALLLAEWRLLVAPRPLLVIVPRHPQRFDEVAALVRDTGFSLARRSGWAEAPSQEAQASDVWLGDSMGEMALYYSAADVALLGGSFAPLGGQNLIEAAACGCPLVMGPHTFNFAEAATLALEAGAARRVADLSAGAAEAMALLHDDPRRAAMVAAGHAFAARHRGAAVRMVAGIVAVMR